MDQAFRRHRIPMPSGKIVEHQGLIAVCQEILHHVGTDKTGTSSD